MKPGTERNQLGRALVKIYYVALAVPKFADLFSVVLLHLVVFPGWTLTATPTVIMSVIQ